MTLARSDQNQKEPNKIQKLGVAQTFLAFKVFTKLGEKINFEVLTKVTPICFVHWAQGE